MALTRLGDSSWSSEFGRRLTRSLRRSLGRVGLALVGLLLATVVAFPQGGGHIIIGDVKVDDSKVGGTSGPIAIHVILYTLTGLVLDRQIVPNGGRYRFSNVGNGEYNIAIEIEGTEIGRLPMMIQSIRRTDFRQDIELELKPGYNQPSKPSSLLISAADAYDRGPSTRALFERADKAVSEKKYDEALLLLNQVIEADPKDFQAWTQLGTVYLGLKKNDEAGKAYAKAVEVRPTFFLALLNLGRLRVMTKQYDAAVEVLTRAVEQRKESADAHFYLGESYLQLRKGTLGAKHLNEALRLDPIGQADAHLRLATLYNAAGLKDRAAKEYEQFLKKKPDHPDRKKFEEYIRANQQTP